MRTVPPNHALLPMLAILALSGCSNPHHSYAPTDEFFASGRFPVPSEFRRGVASRADADAWSCSLLGTNPLESRRIDIDGDGVGELFLSQPAHHGNGGNYYLIFREGRRGFHYLGRLFFASLRPMAADRHGSVRVLTSSPMGGAESMVIIQVLRADGFHCVASRILSCGDSAPDGEGGRLWSRLFDPISPPQDALRLVFWSRVMTPPPHALHLTRRERRGLVRRSLGVGGCHRGVPCTGSLSLGRCR